MQSTKEDIVTEELAPIEKVVSDPFTIKSEHHYLHGYDTKTSDGNINVVKLHAGLGMTTSSGCFPTIEEQVELIETDNNNT